MIWVALPLAHTLPMLNVVVTACLFGIAYHLSQQSTAGLPLRFRLVQFLLVGFNLALAAWNAWVLLP